ncbi:clathrin light chain [Dictyocaulus viviparus]|uniref:Clathrin light chain n=1 Tax=Dictyocaulus viviparus TaxID=29172 RepID=A0A0D8XFE8_DICVI|nr:clathrin light chain [Dictyocaulus viviparus]
MADPVADFLAREQDLLAEIDAAPIGPVINPVPVVPAAEQLGAMAVGPPSVGGGDSGVDLAGMDYQPAHTGMNDEAVPTFLFWELCFIMQTILCYNSTTSSKGSSPVPSLPRVEAENIRRWREQHKILLEKKDEAEEVKKNELRNCAKKELEEWYRQRDAALKLTKEANRKAEEEHLAAFSLEQGEGAQWDEIARLCEAKAQQKSGKDVSRLKSLLLHLKDRNRKWVSFIGTFFAKYLSTVRNVLMAEKQLCLPGFLPVWRESPILLLFVALWHLLTLRTISRVMLLNIKSNQDEY